MSATTQHVVPHGDQWAVKGEGSKRVTVFPTKREAIDAARKIADDLGTDMLVHGKLGQIFYPSPAESSSSLDEEMIRQAVRKAMDVSNSTEKNVRYRVLGPGGPSTGPLAAKNKKLVKLNDLWHEVLAEGTLEPDTYVTLKPSKPPHIVEFLQSDGSTFRCNLQKTGAAVQSKDLLVTLIPNGKGTPKVFACRRKA